MSNLLVSARGDFERPMLFLVDLVSGGVEPRPLPIDVSSSAPPNKRGTMGLIETDNGYAVATWDSITRLDHDLRPTEVHRSALFSDLHGLASGAAGEIFVTSTNAGAVLRIRPSGEIELVWAERAAQLETLIRRDVDLSTATKEQLGEIYRSHVNDVETTSGGLIVSYLGQRPTRWRRRLARWSGRDLPDRNGGLLRISDDGDVTRIWNGQGLHDVVVDGEHLVSTEYFGHAVIRLPGVGIARPTRIPLSGSPLEPGDHLTRGICPTADGWWIGRTLRRGQASGTSRIEFYDRRGVHDGRSIDLPGVKGPYAIIGAPAGGPR